ncbi:Diacylglycerol kinase catalytic domain [Trinorchestia longiramus]|nr:Diacylglycerol kinase catalytic domain [Trinorchestia longiramus]
MERSSPNTSPLPASPQSQRQGSPSRPRHLLVIVNPMSGKKTSEKLFKSLVAPLLHRAAIRITFKKTMHLGHAEELAEDAVMGNDVDGVVTVSGDGTVSEAVTGMMKATTCQLGVPFHDRNTTLPKTRVAFGAIPSGSTNAYMVSTHGTEDTITSVLQIIMGTCRYTHVGGLYVQDQLKHLSPLGVHAGFMGRTLETSTKLRHLGPSREVIAGAKEFFLNRSCSCEVRYLAEDNEQELLCLDRSVCTANCPACLPPPTERNHETEGKWVEIKGDYNMISMCLMTSQCRFSKYGISPMCHVGNGYYDVMMCPKTSRLKVFLRMYRIGMNKDHLTKAPIKAFRTRELHFRSLTSPSPLNCDGELKYYQEFVFKTHRPCLSSYGRGREPLSTLDLSTLTNYFK